MFAVPTGIRIGPGAHGLWPWNDAIVTVFCMSFFVLIFLVYIFAFGFVRWIPF